MGICRQGSLSGGELGRKIPSAVRGTVQLPFFFLYHSAKSLGGVYVLNILKFTFYTS
ncbi:hypothetical protein Hanom_Chr05g00439391 [Helianthus anomalus]